MAAGRPAHHACRPLRPSQCSRLFDPNDPDASNAVVGGGRLYLGLPPPFRRTVDYTAGHGTPVTAAEYLSPAFLNGYGTTAEQAQAIAHRYGAGRAVPPQLWMVRH